jgi:hypothetical protein
VAYASSADPPPTSAIHTSAVWPGCSLRGTISSAYSVMAPKHSWTGKATRSAEVHAPTLFAVESWRSADRFSIESLHER